MTVDYYSLLTNAVTGKDAPARDQIYKDAFSLITRSHLTRSNKLEWPDWQPSGVNTRDAAALLAAAGRPGSPLGARALLLDKPGLLIHGTNSPKTIGHLVASGCIRLVNDDVEDLYRRVSVETRVVFAS